MNVCQITGRRTASGNNVAHCNIKTKRKFKANIHTRKVWVSSLEKFVTVKLSARGLKTLDKKGADVVLKQLGII